MKLTPCLSALFLSVQLLHAKAYVLDEKNYYPPKGVVIEETSHFNFEKGKIVVSAPNGVIKGDMKRSGVDVKEETYLGGAKFLSVLKEYRLNEQVTLGEKVMPEEIKKKAITGVPIIYSKQGGVWRATNKVNKKFTAEQQEEVDKQLKKLNDDASMYGYKARRLGETWDMEKSMLKKLAGEGNMERAEGKVTLKDIVDIDGYPCAKLLCVIDVKGSEDGVKVSFKGEAIIWRNLKHFMDVKAEASLETVVEPNAQVKITGTSIFSDSTTIKEPAINQ